MTIHEPLIAPTPRRVSAQRCGTSLSLVAAIALCASTASAAQPARIVTAGGDITEIVFALGAGDRVVAADTSSVYPASTASLPKVGYQRQLPAEGILAMTPDLIIASDEAGPPTALTQLRDAGVRIEVVTAADTPEGAAAKVRAVAELLDRKAEGETLVADMQRTLTEARAERAADAAAPRVLFIYARGAGTLMIAGRDTPADAMIGLAGGRNAAADVQGFKPLTAEAVVAAQPDVVLMLARGVESLGGADAIWTQPGLAHTPAAKHRRLVAMDDLYLLGFGPRLGDAARDLGRHLHPEIAATR